MHEDLQTIALLSILEQLDGPVSAKERPAMVVEALALTEELLAAGGGGVGEDKLIAIRKALRSEIEE